MAKVTRTKTSGTRRVTKSGDNIGTIIPVADVPLTNLKMAVFGDSGSGKTTFACSFPKKLLVLGCEEGTISIDPKDVKGTDFVAIKSTKQMRALIRRQKEQCIYKTLVVDTLTKYQELVLGEVLGIEDISANMGFGTVDRDQWGEAARVMKATINMLCALTNCNVLFLSQQKSIEPEDTGGGISPTITSALMPSVATHLKPECHYHVQTYLDEIKSYRSVKRKGKVVKIPSGKTLEFCLRLKPTSVVNCKFRSPKGSPVPEYITDPTFEKISELVRGGVV